MRRRDFLTAAAGVGVGAGLVAPRFARGEPWGQGPDEAAAHLLPEGVRAERCLEMFLYGGISAFESFYVVEEHGRPNDPDYPNQQWHLFSSSHADVFGGDCGIPEAEWLQPWQTDANGMSVKLGPLCMPFRRRADIIDRMRVFVMRHDLEPHEAAIPYMLSGMRLGNIRMTGMGAHVQRYFLDRDTTARTTPYSYVFTPNTEFNTDNLRAASAVGQHPGSARPLSLKINSTNTLPELLARGHLSDIERARVDSLLAHYSAAANARHSTLEGELLRGPALEDHNFSLESVANATELSRVLGEELLDPIGGSACGRSDSLDHTGIGIRAAASLLNNPIDPARYVNVIDAGLILADGGGGYDTHFSHLGTQAINATSLMQRLAEAINEPGEGDPTKIDLDETMILLTTEFGRTPFRQSGQGTNHHPYGYITVMLGGPIGPEQAGLLGAIGPDGTATDYITPAEFRAAALSAMGMYPFAHESFAVGDIRDIGTELEGLIWLNEHVLGRV